MPMISCIFNAGRLEVNTRILPNDKDNNVVQDTCQTVITDIELKMKKNNLVLHFIF